MVGKMKRKDVKSLQQKALARCEAEKRALKQSPSCTGAVAIRMLAVSVERYASRRRSP